MEKRAGNDIFPPMEKGLKLFSKGLIIHGSFLLAFLLIHRMSFLALPFLPVKTSSSEALHISFLLVHRLSSLALSFLLPHRLSSVALSFLLVHRLSSVALSFLLVHRLSSLALSFLLVHRMISLALLSFLSQFMIPLGFFLCKLSYSLSFLNCSSILYLQAVLSLLFLLEYLYSTSCQSLLRVVSSVSIVLVQC